MNTYKVILPLLVFDDAGGEHKQGDTFEKEFPSASEEDTAIDTGLLEIVPRTYKVVGTSRVFETAPGDQFEKGLRMGQEAALIAGGHIERVDTKKTAAPKKEKEA
jgi:hypothetical protein